MTVGPKHYEGWTCKDCDKLEMYEYPESVDYKCMRISKFVHDIYHTPKECPFLRGAIVDRIMEVD